MVFIITLDIDIGEHGFKPHMNHILIVDTIDHVIFGRTILLTPRFESNQNSMKQKTGRYSRGYHVEWILLPCFLRLGLTLKGVISTVSVFNQALINQSCSCLEAIDFQVWMQPLIGCWFLSRSLSVTCCVAKKMFQRNSCACYDYLSISPECVAE